MEEEHNIQFPEKFDYALSYQERELPLEGDDTSTLTLQQRLLIYALRQQAKVGKCTEPSPAFWNTKERAMWNAWTEIGHMSSFEAMVYFARILDEEKPGWLKEEIKHRASNKPPAATVSEEPAEDLEKDATDKIVSKPKPSKETQQKDVHVEVISIPSPPGSDRGGGETNEDASLEKQIATLKFRLSNSLRDVNERDVMIAALRAENAQLKELLLQSSSVSDANVSASSSAATTHQSPSSPVQAGYYRTSSGDKPQTWFSWIIGGENEKPPPPKQFRKPPSDGRI
eukprot:TRINITY_DN18703_c1_g1_i1.p1 TRINITY_DN18703_c1_g1~~TRINITY_DN18703_c1_g1_i1.p1  ORF type:complete len:285 (+),score=78.60 TRINITY_DN18703_c1_g1_i1:35-889(+)